ncbi:DgyrCDS3656 [Dimorphilus gyrociliatus]|uniref:ceramidase n=1 Tax=Dimorphilus gyrociliatus TaxID=2664684 RepID=A0A7I8VEF6_9ANNE|nr:DgyrCDS3656 [Dimorphilus gyrociliatus]
MHPTANYRMPVRNVSARQKVIQAKTINSSSITLIFTYRTIVPNYIVNLDDPPENRWHNVAKDKASDITNIMGVLRSFLHEFGYIGDKIFSFVNSDLGKIVETLPNPYRDEIIGISKSSNISLGEIVTYNIFYEIFTVCTSIIAKDDKGNFYHGRNLDFGLFMGWDVKKHSWKITEALRPVVITVDFQKGGKTVFKSAQMAGYIGILTAIKPGIFTLSMDERFDLLDGGYIGVIEWLLGQRKAQWMGFLTRNVMEKADSYDKAKSMLSETTMLAPAYFILGGNSSNQASL